MDDAIKENLKTKHGAELLRIAPDGVELVFRSPRRAEWHRFIDTMSGGDRAKVGRSSAMHKLCQDCLVWPETAEGRPDVAAFNSSVERKPGICQIVAGELAELAGAEDGLDVGKL